MLKKCLFTLFCVLVTCTVSAVEPISGRYEMNATGNRLILDLNADAGVVTGSLWQYVEGDGRITDRHIDIVDGFYAIVDEGRYYVEFEVIVYSDVPEDPPEHFILEGWQSEDGNGFGGLGHSRFDPVHHFPWHAVKVGHYEEAPVEPEVLP